MWAITNLSQYLMKVGEQQVAWELAKGIATRTNRKVRAMYQQPDLKGPQRRKDSEEVQVEDLEQSDMLKTLCHQKRALTTDRWLQFRKIHDQYHCGQEDYKHFLMIISQANYRKLQHPGYYKQLKTEIGNYPALFFSSIEKDIPRTLVDGHPFQSALRNILYCYAIRNPSLLYCQGMNYIVSFLLINGFSQEEGFWFLVSIIEDIVMPDYFKDLSNISITVQVFEDVIKHVFPEFSQEMEELGMESGIFLVSWYICLFTKGFINVVSEYLLEMLILQSRVYPIGFVLVKISLGVMATLFTRDQRFEFEKDFRSLKDSIENNAYDIALQELKVGLDYFDFNYENYKKLAQMYSAKREKNFRQALEKELKEKKVSLPTCNVADPVCLQRIEIEKKIGTVEEVLILKNNIPIRDQFIGDYFPKNIQRGPPKIDYNSSQECPITHHRHICFTRSLEKLVPVKLQPQQSAYFPMHELEASEQMVSRFSKVQDKFNELSNYFIVDESNQAEFEEKLGEDLETSLEQHIGLGSGKFKQIPSPAPRKGSESNFMFSVGNVFKKAFESIKLMKVSIQLEHSR